MNETHKNLLANIRNQMVRHKMDVPDLASACGLSASGLYQILEGTNAPKIPYLETMAKLFGLNVADLFGEPVAQRMPTIHEALRVIQAAAERIEQVDKATHGPKRELLDLVATLDQDEADLLLAAAKNFGPRPWPALAAKSASDHASKDQPNTAKRHRNNR